jgi:hypothetical protein
MSGSPTSRQVKSARWRRCSIFAEAGGLGARGRRAVGSVLRAAKSASGHGVHGVYTELHRVDSFGASRRGRLRARRHHHDLSAQSSRIAAASGTRRLTPSGGLETCLPALDKRRHGTLPGSLRVADTANLQQRHSGFRLPVVALGDSEPGTEPLSCQLSFKPGEFIVTRVALSAKGGMTAIGAKRYPAAVPCAFHRASI